MKNLKDKIEAIKNYYSSEDFINNYAEYLLEDHQAAIERVKEMLNIRNYEVNEFYSGSLDFCDSDKAEQIIDYIIDNIEEFTTTFVGYYVGYTSLSAINFGEQCEELHEDVEKYGKEAVRKAYEEADFYVNDECSYAYYNLDGGVHIDLLLQEIPLIKEMLKK